MDKDRRRTGTGALARAVIACCLLVGGGVGSAPAAAATAVDTGQGAGAAAVADAPSLVAHPKRPFDLVGRQLRFSPIATDPSGYATSMAPLYGLAPRGQLIAFNEARRGHGYAYRSKRVTLPFEFPYGGRMRKDMAINLNGNVSFGLSEVELHGNHAKYLRAAHNRGFYDVATTMLVGALRDPQLHAIMALWSPYDDEGQTSKVYLNTTADAVTVTWDVVRPKSLSQAPMGRNVFQLTLRRGGAFELAYEKVAEEDGIVGLMNGVSSSSTELQRIADPVQTGAAGDNDIVAAEARDAGMTLRFDVTFSRTLPRSPNHYVLHLNADGRRCDIRVKGDRLEAVDAGSCTGSDPPGYDSWFEIKDRVVTFFIPKLSLHTFSAGVPLTWSVSTYNPLSGASDRAPDVGTGSIPATAWRERNANLSDMPTTIRGNFLELFHYPILRDDICPLARLYRDAGMTQNEQDADDMAVVFTGYRTDIVPGSGYAHKTLGRGGMCGYPRLQTMIGTLDATLSREKAREWGWVHYVDYLVHELTHNWSGWLRATHPQTGQPLNIGDGSHWLDYLHAPAYFPSAEVYGKDPATDSSQNGGRFWQQTPSGWKAVPSYNPPYGLSALDLYGMGMLAPEEVPDTFVLKPAVPGGAPTEKIEFGIEDVIAAMGPRQPSAAEARKDFNLSFYFVPEPGKPADPELKTLVDEAVGRVARYYGLATNGRMRVNFVPRGNAPVAQFRTYANTEGASGSRRAIAGTLPARDRDNRALRWSILTQPSKGTLTRFDPQTGEFEYLPTTGDPGYDFFTYTVSNGTATSNEGLIDLRLMKTSTEPDPPTPLDSLTPPGLLAPGATPPVSQAPSAARPKVTIVGKARRRGRYAAIRLRSHESVPASVRLRLLRVNSRGRTLGRRRVALPPDSTRRFRVKLKRVMRPTTRFRARLYVRTTDGRTATSGRKVRLVPRLAAAGR